MKNTTTRIANLPMYDWPEIEHAHDNLWYSIQKKLNSSGVDAPKLLYRDDDLFSIWQNEEMLIGQTCGWPFANMLGDCCIPIAAINYDIEDCPPGTYNCVYIGQSKKDIRFLKDRETLLEAGKIAVNSNISQSGFHVFKEITKLPSDVGVPEDIRLVTGSHRSSIAAVAEGKAQLAAIDTVCFELARAHDPDIVKNVSVLGRSIPKPGPPIVTSKRFKGIIPALLEALAFGIYNLSEADQKALLIRGMEPARADNYKIYL